MDAIKSHRNCIACSEHHLIPSLALHFDWLDKLRMHSRFFIKSDYQGYEGLLHGGVASTLLDAIMTHHLLARNIMALTGSLKLRFHQRVEVNQWVDLYAREQSFRHGVYSMRATLLLANHDLAIEATAHFMPVAEATIK
ncbi:PaaI family thioesterase [Celerinatantimonas diazotrophica]|uniref:Thioesterase domain-containing protein n=1 Tax=Celerinatantimonas diazotrophica TaxID=412034 RepID=A0A4V2PRE9_9GAMM|nr:PaaI family thioesterase [Celerinatantimonas diazotrophica]TCK58551.1 hypothetical protein EV690_0679 [Celerinatantimonas diazotrophica]CAG9297180.1 hypothetical protein CEDIAZO_02349 [Celerinatantimonas diazotrophica]